MAGPDFGNPVSILFLIGACLSAVFVVFNPSFRGAWWVALVLAAIGVIYALVYPNIGALGGGGGGNDQFCQFDPCYCCSEPGGQYSYDCNPECTSAGVLGSQQVDLSICDERARNGAINENCVIFQ